MNIFEVNDFSQLREFRDAWQELLQQTPCANFFQSFDWLEVYWKHFGAEQQLRVLLMEQSGELTGILPIVIRREKTKLGQLRFATYPMDHWGSFYGPIGAQPFAILTAGIDYLQTFKQDWDVLEPRWLGAYPEECAEVEKLLRSTGHSPVRSEIDATSVVELRCGWENYLSTRKSKWRNNARRWEKQLNELGEVTYLRYRPDADGDMRQSLELYDECLRIASASWQGGSTTGTTLTHKSVSAFLRDVHVAAAKCGCLDLNLLKIDGRAMAFTYNYVFRGSVFSLRSGFDPSCKVKGTGSLLSIKAIEDSFQRGDWRYDLGPKHLECKRNLWTHLLPVYRISCFKRGSVRQQLMRLKRILKPAPTTAELGNAAIDPVL